MKEFLKYVVPHYSKYVRVNMPIHFDRKLKQRCVELLGYTSEADLKLKHEGFTFFDTFSKEVLGVISIKKYLNQSTKDFEKNIDKNFIPEISYNGKQYKVITFQTEDIPLIDAVNKQDVIFVMRKDNNLFLICGIASVDVLNTCQLKEVRRSIVYDLNKIGFIGFDKLQPLPEE